MILNPKPCSSGLFHVLNKLNAIGSHIQSGGTDTTAWQTYTGAINIKNDKKGVGTFEYYSVDTASNVETTKTKVLQ